MKSDKVFKILKDTLSSNKRFNESFEDIQYHTTSPEFPNSVVAFFENEKSSGEIAIFLIPENHFCEFQHLIFQNSRFNSENSEFRTKEELVSVLSKFANTVLLSV